jgi:hypothetical protein
MSTDADADTNAPPVRELSLTPEEQWVVHSALLDYVEVARREDTELPAPSVELTILERIEDGEWAFTAFELDRLRYECAHHAESQYAPEADREHARSVVEKIDRQCSAGLGR